MQWWGGRLAANAQAKGAGGMDAMAERGVFGALGVLAGAGPDVVEDLEDGQLADGAGIGEGTPRLHDRCRPAAALAAALGSDAAGGVEGWELSAGAAGGAAEAGEFGETLHLEFFETGVMDGPGAEAVAEP